MLVDEHVRGDAPDPQRRRELGRLVLHSDPVDMPIKQAVRHVLRVRTNLIGLGALVGVVVAGQIADRLLRQGRPSARVTVGTIGSIAAAVIFVPTLLSPLLVVSVPLFVFGGAALAAPDSPLNTTALASMDEAPTGEA